MSEITNAKSAETGTEAIREKFRSVASATDTPAPGDGTMVPRVDLEQLILPLAREVGMIMRSAPLFRFGESIVTVHPETGKIAPMTARRFPSWVENYLVFTKPAKNSPVVSSISTEMSSRILEADAFLDELRELNAVSEVRVPVWKNVEGSRSIELSPEGYHALTGIFTVNRIPYDENLCPVKAWEFIYDLLKNFPWELEGAETVKKSRPFSAQIAAMLGTYCHALFPEGTPKPMVVHLANQPGSGKTLLVRIALTPVHGTTDDRSMPYEEKKVEELLDTTAAARKPYLVLDDLKSLNSPALNRWITSPRHAWRVMYSQREASIGKITQTWANGNNLNLTADLERRALVIDLFCKTEATERTFPREITLHWLFSKETRASLLSALWALVRVWIEKGMPEMTEGRRPSFEDYSGLVGGMVSALGLPNPFAPRPADAVGGDEATKALKMVLAKLVARYETADPPVFTTTTILEAAEEMQMLDIIVGFAKDPRRRLGQILPGIIGREDLKDSRGRIFTFGKRNVSAGATYPIRFLGYSSNPTSAKAVSPELPQAIPDYPAGFADDPPPFE